MQQLEAIASSTTPGHHHTVGVSTFADKESQLVRPAAAAGQEPRPRAPAGLGGAARQPQRTAAPAGGGPEPPGPGRGAFQTPLPYRTPVGQVLALSQSNPFAEPRALFASPVQEDGPAAAPAEATPRDAAGQTDPGAAAGQVEAGAQTVAKPAGVSASTSPLEEGAAGTAARAPGHFATRQEAGVVEHLHARIELLERTEADLRDRLVREKKAKDEIQLIHSRYVRGRKASLQRKLSELSSPKPIPREMEALVQENRELAAHLVEEQVKRESAEEELRVALAELSRLTQELHGKALEMIELSGSPSPVKAKADGALASLARESERFREKLALLDGPLQASADAADAADAAAPGRSAETPGAPEASGRPVDQRIADLQSQLVDGNYPKVLSPVARPPQGAWGSPTHGVVEPSPPESPTKTISTFLTPIAASTNPFLDGADFTFDSPRPGAEVGVLEFLKARSTPRPAAGGRKEEEGEEGEAPLYESPAGPSPDLLPVARASIAAKITTTLKETAGAIQKQAVKVKEAAFGAKLTYISLADSYDQPLEAPDVLLGPSEAAKGEAGPRPAEGQLDEAALLEVELLAGEFEKLVESVQKRDAPTPTPPRSSSPAEDAEAQSAAEHRQFLEEMYSAVERPAAAPEPPSADGPARRGAAGMRDGTEDAPEPETHILRPIAPPPSTAEGEGDSVEVREQRASRTTLQAVHGETSLVRRPAPAMKPVANAGIAISRMRPPPNGRPAEPPATKSPPAPAPRDAPAGPPGPPARAASSSPPEFMQSLADQRAAEKWADSLAGRPKKALDGALQEEALKHREALDTERRKREQYLAARVPGLADAPPVAAAPRNAGAGRDDPAEVDFEATAILAGLSHNLSMSRRERETMIEEQFDRLARETFSPTALPAARGAVDDPGSPGAAVDRATNGGRSGPAANAAAAGPAEPAGPAVAGAAGSARILVAESPPRSAGAPEASAGEPLPPLEEEEEPALTPGALADGIAEVMAEVLTASSAQYSPSPPPPPPRAAESGEQTLPAVAAATAASSRGGALPAEAAEATPASRPSAPEATPTSRPEGTQTSQLEARAGRSRGAQASPLQTPYSLEDEVKSLRHERDIYRSRARHAEQRAAKATTNLSDAIDQLLDSKEALVLERQKRQVRANAAAAGEYGSPASAASLSAASAAVSPSAGSPGSGPGE